jgi:hypothetical protein
MFFTIYNFLGLHKGRPSYRRSLQLSKETYSTSKHEIFKKILLLWVIFYLLYLSSDSEYGSGSTDLIESGSETLQKDITIIEHTRDLPWEEITGHTSRFKVKDMYFCHYFMQLVKLW